jgi:hypothetical protein
VPKARLRHEAQSANARLKQSQQAVLFCKKEPKNFYPFTRFDQARH